MHKYYYWSAFVVYSLLLLGVLFYILMWSLGMSTEAKWNTPLTIITTVIFSSIITLLVYPFLPQSKRLLVKIAGVLNVLYLIFVLVLAVWFVWRLDLTVFTSMVMLLFLASGVTLVTQTVKHFIRKS